MNELTEHQKLCNKVKAKARKRLKSFIRIAKESYKEYYYKSRFGMYDHMPEGRKAAIAKDLVEYLKTELNSKMLEDYK